jgi:predicted RNase H-like HicB family nuclease
MTIPTTKTLDDYLAMPYEIVLTPEYDAWTATIPDLPGCMAVGDTPEAALELLQDAKQSWMAASLLHNLPIPEPSRYGLSRQRL